MARPQIAASSEIALNGFSKHKCFNGAKYLRMHYSVDPGKDPNTPRGAVWHKEHAPPVSPIKEWQREMEMSEVIHDGEPIFADYVDHLHCPLGGRECIPVMPGSVYLGGWDCGQTLVPAFVLIQVMSIPPYQIHVLMEVVSPGIEPMDKFANRVMQRLVKILPGNWNEVEHWADATVTTMNGANGETAQQAARRHGFNLRQSSNVWDPRLAAVTWGLTDRLDEGTARMIIDGVRCPVLREGFQGAYKVDLSTQGEEVGPGRVLKAKPLKNSFSHVQDALQYPMMALFKKFGRPKESRANQKGVTTQQSAIAAILGRQI